MYWEQVLNDFLQKKKAEEQKIYESFYNHKNTRNSKTYYLGINFENIYFTKREAECMLLMLKGKTVNEMARVLKLSPRTIEYYTKNMKIKLGCRTKYNLIKIIEKSDFIKNLDFDI